MRSADPPGRRVVVVGGGLAGLSCALELSSRGPALAGDYTRQQYLATMEGAVVSGRLAARAVEEARRRPASSRAVPSPTGSSLLYARA